MRSCPGLSPGRSGLIRPVIRPHPGLLKDSCVDGQEQRSVKGHQGETHKDVAFCVQSQRLWHLCSLCIRTQFHHEMVTAVSHQLCFSSPTSAVPSAPSQEHLLSGCLRMLTGVSISDAFCGTWEELSRVEHFLCTWTSWSRHHAKGPCTGSPLLNLQALPHTAAGWAVMF